MKNTAQENPSVIEDTRGHRTRIGRRCTELLNRRDRLRWSNTPESRGGEDSILTRLLGLDPSGKAAPDNFGLLTDVRFGDPRPASDDTNEIVFGGLRFESDVFCAAKTGCVDETGKAVGLLGIGYRSLSGDTELQDTFEETLVIATNGAVRYTRTPKPKFGKVESITNGIDSSGSVYESETIEGSDGVDGTDRYCTDPQRAVNIIYKLSDRVSGGIALMHRALSESTEDSRKLSAFLTTDVVL